MTKCKNYKQNFYVNPYNCPRCENIDVVEELEIKIKDNNEQI